MSAAWQTLGRPAPGELGDARLELHHAAQLVAAVGKTLLEPRSDDSHPNLGWLGSKRALSGHAIPGPRPFRAALRPADLQLLVLDEGGGEAESFGLPGRTLADGRRWLEGIVAERTGRGLAPGLVPTGYELPPHPVADGAAFAFERPEAFAELARWLADADGALAGVASRTDGASEVRCWPHHFDLATLVTLEAAPDGSAARTVGLGLSPGDASYPEPYWYVSPWPYPDASLALPALPAGRWHREGFTAAILTGSELVTGGPPETQPERLDRFLEAALAAGRRLLGR